MKDTMPGASPLVPDGLSAEDLLRAIAEYGIIDAETARAAGDRLKEMEKQKTRQEVLNSHHIWLASDGMWKVHLPGNGKNNRVTVKRKDLDDLCDEIARREAMTANVPTAAEIFREWNDRRAEQGFIKPSTHDVNEELFDRSLSKFGEQHMNDITYVWIAEYLEGLVAGGNMTAKAFANVKGLVKGTLKEARRRKLIGFTAEDVFRELDIPERAFKKTKKDDSEEVFTPEEVKLIGSYILSEPTIRNLAILLMFISGIRVGELVALTWDDVHDGYLVVDQTETRKKNADGKWEFYVRDSAKTEAGERLVAIPESCRWIWGAIREAATPSDTYIFVDEEGRRLRANCIRSRMKKVCRRVGIPPRSPHKARKTYCTILIESQLFSSAQIIRQVGHADFSITESRYHKDRSSLDEKIHALSQIPEFKFAKEEESLPEGEAKSRRDE